MRSTKPTVAVLATIDSKGREALFVADALARAGARPWLLDLSLKPHDRAFEGVGGQRVAEAAGASWRALGGRSRLEASAAMAEGARRLLLAKFAKGEIAGAIGLGGANGTGLACSVMRALPYLVPKVMVSAVAATAAVEWYVGESDIVMVPSIGDISRNRITDAVMENAALALAAAARNFMAKRDEKRDHPPLVAISSFGGTAPCVERVGERLEASGYEVILFHASGVGGRSLERLAASGELAGVVDLTTHELTDLLVDGVYSAGENRLTSAGAAGLPQVVVPGATDHANFWVGAAPQRFEGRDFLQYNEHNLLMRTDGEEFASLGRLFAERLNRANGPVRVLIPLEGFSEHTRRRVSDLAGNDKGSWKRAEDYRVFAEALKADLRVASVEELALHINDGAFADACAEAFLAIAKP